MRPASSGDDISIKRLTTSDPDPHLLGWERRRGGRVKCSLLQFYVSWYRYGMSLLVVKYE